RNTMRMRRRDFITMLTGAAIAGPRAALAQTPPKIFRLGTLAPGPAIDEKNPLGATLLKALEQRGYALGKNLSLEPRGAGGQVGRLDELVRELKAKEVDVIVAAGYGGARLQACERADGCRLWRRRSRRDQPHRFIGAARRQHHRHFRRRDDALDQALGS